jgi:hypothetical protein
MRKIPRPLVLLGVLALAGAACAPTDPVEEGGPAEVELAVTSVPSGVGCLVVIATGGITVKRNFSVTAGATSRVTMKGLSTGSTKFDAAAYAGTCPPASTAEALWVADTRTVNLAGGVTGSVSLTLRKAPAVNATLDFSNNSCAPGSSLCSSSCVNLSTDSANCGTCGTVCATGTTCTMGACQPSCANVTCGAGRVCSAGACLREVFTDCAQVASLTGNTLFNETFNTNISTVGVDASLRVGASFVHLNEIHQKVFLSFDCSAAPSRSGLQSATLALSQNLSALEDGDVVAVAHVLFDTVSFAHWSDRPLDRPGALGPATATLEDKTLDVAASVTSDLVVGRTTSQFRLEMTSNDLSDMSSTHFVEFESVVQALRPRLRLRFLLP